ncbi:MAG TPA: aromatic amino acid ammonia-lyase, partial [Polyangiaceae bacterium]|nr:aromatic amino acid ammonia-lyase [Polyangiaceae bacterium]
MNDLSRHEVVVGDSLNVDLKTLVAVARHGASVSLEAATRANMNACHSFFTSKVDSRVPIYGLNTQFGDQVVLLDEHLDDYEGEHYQDSLKNRQISLIKSHNCGMGERAPTEIVRGAMLLRSRCLSRGYSGVRPEVVDAYFEFLNRGITPDCFRYGSIGASGDLIPLATIAAAVVGEDVQVRYDDCTIPVRTLLSQLGLPALRVQGREGLALINGTSFMSSIAGLALHDLSDLFDSMLSVIAMALESLLVIEEGYHPIVHELKGHRGELAVAERIRSAWAGSRLIRDLEKARSEGTAEIGVQDYYSLRSVAQGFGVFYENLARARQWVESEMNSVNDNPIVVPEHEQVYHTANFMGYYVSSACDMLRADIAQAATWLHALVANLVHPRKNRGLPVNLIDDPTNYSGFRPIQILAASLTVQCRKLAQSHASFVIPTEGDNQDVNSLGTHAAFDLRASVQHLQELTGILLMAASQAIELRGIEKASGKSRAIVEEYRQTVPYLREDRLVHADLTATVETMRRMVSLGGHGPAMAKDEPARRTSAVFLKATPHGPVEELPLEEAATGSK